MTLYIQINNNEAFEHPITEDNLLQLFPDFDPENLPEGFAKFQRIQAPTIGVYERVAHTGYQLIDGVYQDTWLVSMMTDTEIESKQQAVEAAGCPFDDWIFDKETCSWLSPIPYPTDGKLYKWDNQTRSWEMLGE